MVDTLPSIQIQCIKVELTTGVIRVDGFWERAYSANGDIERSYTLGLMHSSG